MEEIYAATDILVSTSLSESFGLVFAEAQASGIPVVTTNVGGQRSVVKDGKTGFLVPPQKPNRIAAKVSILINDLKLHQTFSRNAHRHIERNFSLKTYVRRVEKLYGKIISTKWQ
jgi:glycosyltransferase involved in cell wall biosynthesis